MNLEAESNTFIDVVPEWKHEYEFIGSNGDVLYFMTDEDAPRKRVVSADLSDPATPSWSEVIPEQESTLKSVQHVGGELIANTMQDATTRLVRWDEHGTRKGEIKLPGLGTANASGGERDHGETFYSFSSFTTPPTIYHLDLASGESRKIDGSHLDFDFSKYVVRQVFYSSKDGTRVPMFLVHHVDMKQDGSNPTLLYGYGGFDISLTPYFSPARLAWVEMGACWRSRISVVAESTAVNGTKPAPRPESRTCSMTSSPLRSGWSISNGHNLRASRSRVAPTVAFWLVRA